MSENLADVVHEAIKRTIADLKARQPVTLTEFLLARIAEDESAARYLMDNWPTSREDMTWLHWHTTPPARVLAECEAKREIIDEHHPIAPGVNINSSGYAPAGEPVCGCCGEAEWYCVGWPCPTLCALAQPYSEHGDFDPAWRL